MAIAFFYGTLMVPDILKRVTQTNGEHLEIAPALLTDHTRHQVKNMDYPGVVPYATSVKLIGRELTEDERSVRGVIVKGLTKSDFQLLDNFEGMAYDAAEVSVYPLAPYGHLSAKSPQELLSTDIAIPTELPEPVTASVYLWTAPTKWLSPELWSYKEFLEERLHRWVSRDPDEGEEDRALERDAASEGPNGSGRFSHSPSVEDMVTLIQETDDEFSSDSVPTAAATFPKLGHGMLKYFNFDDGYINTNNGSYGSLPKPVQILADEYGRKIESSPDLYMRRKIIPMINIAREKVAKIINCDLNEVVITSNTTHGVSSILMNLNLKAGDIVVEFLTTYESVNRAIQYHVDRVPGLIASSIPLIMPTSHADMLKLFRAHLQSLPRHEGQRIVAVIDGCSSNPGIVFPWVEMVQVCKEENVFSLVDAAHGIGLVEVDLNKVSPDAWVSNCHKWLFSKRGSAAMYVPKRNHHLMTSSFPTSANYFTPVPGAELSPRHFANVFIWTGTHDFVPYVSIVWAINFRRTIGGEARIREYNRTLAIEGGLAAAKILGTRIMDDTPNYELTSAMVDVLLPLPVGDEHAHADLAATKVKIQDGMFANNFYVAPHVHDGKWWVRISAQIWLELSDFERVGQGLLQICKDIQDAQS